MNRGTRNARVLVGQPRGKETKRQKVNRRSADISFSAYSAYFAVNLFPAFPQLPWFFKRRD